MTIHTQYNQGFLEKIVLADKLDPKKVKNLENWKIFDSKIENLMNSSIFHPDVGQTTVHWLLDIVVLTSKHMSAQKVFDH